MIITFSWLREIIFAGYIVFPGYRSSSRPCQVEQGHVLVCQSRPLTKK